MEDLIPEVAEDPEYLAAKIGEYPYQSIAVLLSFLEKELTAHSRKDRDRGRPMRSLALNSAVANLAKARDSLTSLFSPSLDSISLSTEQKYELAYRAYSLSRFRYTQLAELFDHLPQKTVHRFPGDLLSQHFYKVRDYLLVAGKLSP